MSSDMTRRPVFSQRDGGMLYDGEEQSPSSDPDDLEQLLTRETRLRRDGSDALLIDEAELFDDALDLLAADLPDECDFARAVLSVVRLGAA